MILAILTKWARQPWHIPFNGCLFSLCGQGQFHSADVFQDVMPLCEQVHSMVDKVFGNNAEVVMGKLVQNVHEEELKVWKKKQSKVSQASLLISQCEDYCYYDVDI